MRGQQVHCLRDIEEASEAGERVWRGGEVKSRGSYGRGLTYLFLKCAVQWLLVHWLNVQPSTWASLEYFHHVNKKPCTHYHWPSGFVWRTGGRPDQGGWELARLGPRDHWGGADQGGVLRNQVAQPGSQAVASAERCSPQAVVPRESRRC